MEDWGLNKILITGGSGFLGSNLANELAKKKSNKVYIFDNNFRGNIKNLEKLNNLIFIKGDIRNTENLKKIIKKVDIVFHLAFINGTRNFYEKPDLVLDVGITGTINIIKLINTTKNKVKKFIYASSSEIYQTPKKIPTPEDVQAIIPNLMNPRFSYGGAKMIGELLTLYLLKKSIKKIIFRPHNIYGPNMGSLHVVPQFLQKIKNKLKNLKKKTQKLTIKIQGNGKETRAFCYIKDAIDAIIILSKKGKDNEIYNIGNDKEYSIKELIKKIEKIVNVKILVKSGKLEKGSTLRRCPNINKIKKLGYRPKWSLEKGLLYTSKNYIKS